LGFVVFALGFATSLGAGLLIFFGMIESGWAAVVGMVGIGLMATSQFAARTRRDQDWGCAPAE
jgi:hypothetical protein